MLTKYASYEVAEILDLKGAPSRDRTASLDKLSDFADYRTEDGYLYARIRAISSRVNKNHDGWPSVELAGGQEDFDRIASQHRTASFTVEATPDARYGYSTFLGKPIFIDHHNSDPSRARGAIVDAKLHVEDHKTASELDPYYAGAPDNHLPPTWVELLLEVDAKSFPKFAQAVLDGAKDPRKGIDGFSMGCDVERSVCNICKNSATSPDEYCQHIRMKGAHFNYIDPRTGQKTSARSYEDCYGIKFFEISGVFDPADETALTREVRAALVKEGEYSEEAQAGLAADMQGRHTRGEHSPDDWEYWANEGCPLCANEPAPARVVTPGVHPITGRPLTLNADELHQELSDWPTTQHPLGPAYGSSPDLSLDMYNPDIASAPCPHCQGNGCERCNYRGYLVNARTASIKEALSAKDYRMLADLIATAPVSERAALAEHAAGYLKQTNPAFDADRFMAAAIGNPQSGQDQFGGGRDYPAPEQPDEPTIPGLAPQLIQSGHEAANPPPQSTLIALPEEVDTLRKEEVCPVCGSTIDDETCSVCGYIEPPEGFDNPDLSKAQEERVGPQESEGPQFGPEFADAADVANKDTSNQPSFAHVTNDMTQDPSTRTAAGTDQETPVVPNTGPASDEPTEDVLEDPKEPVTSKVRTAQDFIAAAGANPRRQMTNHTADAASGAPAVASPDVNTEVEGVGGVSDASNEQASKADAQIDVEGVGGTGVEGVGSDSTVSVDQGDEHSKNIEAIPTKTFDDGSSAVERQHDPVGGEAFPSSEDGVKSSGWHIEALEGDPFPRPEDAPYGEGGAAVQGVQPVDAVGRPDERVNVLDPVTSPENNSGPTDTWSGTDGNGVLRQQDPTTTETLEGNDGVKKSTHMLTAFQLADLEIKLGMLEDARKYQRIAELEGIPYREVKASLEYAQRVRTAAQGGRLAGPARTATRLPVLGRKASEEESSESSEEEIPDEAIFVK